MDRIENTSPNISYIFALRSFRTDRVGNTAFQLLHCCVLQIFCKATGVFAESFPSNGCLGCLHISCLEQMCHNILTLSFLKTRYVVLKSVYLLSIPYMCYRKNGQVLHLSLYIEIIKSNILELQSFYVLHILLVYAGLTQIEFAN
jgi:hypothetical protein